jgi:hypothetical protein
MFQGKHCLSPCRLDTISGVCRIARRVARNRSLVGSSAVISRPSRLLRAASSGTSHRARRAGTPTTGFGALLAGSPLTGACRRSRGRLCVTRSGVCAGSGVSHNCYATLMILARYSLDEHAMYTFNVGQVICCIYSKQEKKVSCRGLVDPLYPVPGLRLLPTSLAGREQGCLIKRGLDL